MSGGVQREVDVLQADLEVGPVNDENVLKLGLLSNY